MASDNAERVKRCRVRKRQRSVLPKRRTIDLPPRVAENHDSLALLPSISLRSYWGKKWVSVIAALTSDRGGATSEAVKILIRHSATLEVTMDLMTQKLALAGDDPPTPLVEAFQRACNTQRRLLETIGTQRQPRDITLGPPASEPVSPVVAEVRRKAFAESDTTSLMALFRAEERKAEETTNEPAIVVVRRGE